MTVKNRHSPPLRGNDLRAARIEHILKWSGYDDELNTNLRDLLADARHWCDRNSASYAELDRQAYHNYLAEIHPVYGDEV